MLSGSRDHNRTPLYALLTANIVSMIGNELTFIAIAWFVLETTGSAARTGITVAVSVVAMIVAGFFSGALVDRLGYKRMSIISDLASGVNIALIPLLHYTVGIAFWQLLVLVFLGAILDTPGHTARNSLLPELIERAGMRPERANSIYMIAGRLASVIGAPLAGLLIALLGTSRVLWIDAATFAISAAVLTALIPSSTNVPEATETKPERQPYLRELADGFRFIRNDPLLFWMIVTMSMGSLLAEPLYSVILPVYAREVFGEALDLGFMFAALGIGSIIGGLIYATAGHKLPRRLTFVGGFFGRALTFWLLVTIPPLGIVMVAIIVNAIVLEPVNPLSMTVYQERVPEGMRGRVFGTSMALGNITRPIGMIAYGFILSGVGLETTLYILAIVNLIPPTMMFFVPAFRNMRAPARQASTTRRVVPA